MQEIQDSNVIGISLQVYTVCLSVYTHQHKTHHNKIYLHVRGMSHPFLNPASLYHDPQERDLAQPRAAAVAPAAVSPCILVLCWGSPKEPVRAAGWVEALLCRSSSSGWLLPLPPPPSPCAPQHPCQPSLRVSARTNWAAAGGVGGSGRCGRQRGGSRDKLGSLADPTAFEKPWDKIAGLRGTRGRGFSS